MYTLYSYYRSSCSWRVRLALEIKGIPYKIIQVNLLENEQSQEEYLKINPSGVVPALLIDATGIILTQSVAILEFLEEAHPDGSSLLPNDPILRAKIRQLVQVIASDCQPLQNLHVLRRVTQLAGLSSIEEAKQLWGREYIIRALTAYESLLLRDQQQKDELLKSITLADISLIPQLYNARRFGIIVDEQFPLLKSREDLFESLHPKAFKNAHPDSELNNKSNNKKP